MTEHVRPVGNGEMPAEVGRGRSTGFWVLLFLVVVVFPVAMAHRQVEDAVLHSAVAGRSQFEHRLEDAAEFLDNRASPHAILQNLIGHLVTLPPEEMRAKLIRFSEQVPGVLRCLVWDGQGRLVPLPAGIQLQPAGLWEEVAQTFFRFDSIGAAEFSGNPGHPLADRIQPFLGSEISLQFVMECQGLPRSFVRDGRPGLGCWSTGKRWGTGNRRQSRRGLLIMADLSAWSPAQTLDLAVRGSSWYAGLQEPGIVAGLLGLGGAAEGRGDWFPPPLPLDGKFRDRVREALLRRTGQTFEVGGWLIRVVTREGGGGKTALLAANIGTIEEDGRRWRRVTRWGMAFWVLLAGSGLLWLRWRGEETLPLAWRTLGLLLLALMIPSASLFHAGSLLGARERERGRLAAFERLREVQSRLGGDREDCPAHEQARLQSLAPVLRRTFRDPAAGLALLDRLVREKNISGYFLSDARGNLDRLSGGSVPADFRTAISLIIRVAFAEDIGGPQSRTQVVAGVVQEHFADLFPTERGVGETRLISFRPEVLRPFKTNRKATWFFKMVVPSVEGPRLLVLELEEALIEYRWASRVFRANPFAVGTGGRIPVEMAFITATRGYPNLPDRSLIERMPQFSSTAWERISEREVELDGERFALLLDRPRGQIYERCLYASLRGPYQRAEEQRRTFLLIALTAVAAAGLLGLLLSGQFLVPIRRVDHALQAVEAGDLEVRLPVRSDDEIGHVSRSFNRMVSGLRERERMRAYVSDSVLEAVQDSASGKWHQGEVVEATILFSDVRSFTTLCEKHPPEAMFAMLNAFLGGAEKELRAFGGQVDKFIGDAVMAVFREPGPEQALHAVQAALAVKAFLVEFNRRREAEGTFPIQIGVGISTGRVMQGNIGSERRKDLTVIGDEVNLAARLETASKEGRHTQIVLSEGTYALVRHAIEAVEMPQRTVKGKEQPIRMYEVVGPKK